MLCSMSRIFLLKLLPHLKLQFQLILLNSLGYAHLLGHIVIDFVLECLFMWNSHSFGWLGFHYM